MMATSSATGIRPDRPHPSISVSKAVTVIAQATSLTKEQRDSFIEALYNRPSTHTQEEAFQFAGALIAEARDPPLSSAMPTNIVPKQLSCGCQSVLSCTCPDAPKMAVMTKGLSIDELNKLGEFVNFARLPNELQLDIWGFHWINDHRPRNYQVMITRNKEKEKGLRALFKQPIYTIHFNLVENFSNRPPSIFDICQQANHFAASKRTYVHAFPVHLNTKSDPYHLNLLIDFKIDTLSVVFPFVSALVHHWVDNQLAPWSEYKRPPIELIQEPQGREVLWSCLTWYDIAAVQVRGHSLWRRRKGIAIHFKMGEFEDDYNMTEFVIHSMMGGVAHGRPYLTTGRRVTRWFDDGAPKVVDRWDRIWSYLMEILTDQEVKVDTFADKKYAGWAWWE